MILTRTPGYLLRVEPGQLDRDRFDALVAEARSHDDPETAVELLHEALGLWRGPPLQEFAFEDFARTEIARLEDLRLSVVGERVELELRLGRHADLVGELEALVAAHPLREQLRGQLMRALYGSGRQAEALQVYRDARRLLVEELGIEPSLPLRELEQAILRQDAQLEPETTVVAAAPAPAIPTASPEPQPPVEPARVPDVRKTVTIVFSDLVDSSRLSLQLDPEAHRNLLGRYFDEMRAVVERHGGIVEKYIGDAVMAVFGVPVLHEDDALRAVRAAVEMREALAELNDDLERGWGVRLAARIGVNTGEVIAGDHSQGHLFVTGEGGQRRQAARGGGRAERDRDRRDDPPHSYATRFWSSGAGSADRSSMERRSTPSVVVGGASRTRPDALAVSIRPSSGASGSAPHSQSVFGNVGQRSGLPPAHGARRRRHGQVTAGAGVRRRRSATT